MLVVKMTEDEKEETGHDEDRKHVDIKDGFFDFFKYFLLFPVALPVIVKKKPRGK